MKTSKQATVNWCQFAAVHGVDESVVCVFPPMQGRAVSTETIDYIYDRESPESVLISSRPVVSDKWNHVHTFECPDGGVGVGVLIMPTEFDLNGNRCDVPTFHLVESKSDLEFLRKSDESWPELFAELLSITDQNAL